MRVKVAGYGRVSTQSQIDGTSPEEQQQSIESECKSRGYELVKFYSDLAFSGSDDNRPELQKLIADAKLGKFQTVMCTKMDRLGRNLRDLKNIIHELSNSDLNFIFVQQPELSSNGIYGDLLLNVLGSFAEFERLMIKDRFDRGRIRRWKEGDGAIGSLPLGYTRGDGKIEVDPEGSKTYQWIISMYLYENYSFRDIAIKLTAEGIPTPSGRSNKWSNVTVSKIIKNPAYTGEAIQNRYEFAKKRGLGRGKQYYSVSKIEKPPEEWITIKYPPLITQENFDQLGDRIENQKKKPKKHHVGREDHFMLENILFCGYCGARIKKRFTRIANYCCYWWKASPKERQISQHEKCKLATVSADEVDRLIYNDIVEVLSNPGRFAKDWLKDINVEELRNKIEALRDRDEVLKAQVMEGFKHIKNTNDPNLRGMYQTEIKKDETEFQVNQHNLRVAESDLAFTQNKYDRLTEFNEAMNGTLGKKVRKWYSTKNKLEEYLYALPFQKKKRIIEAVIAPANGGKINIRYGTKADDDREGEIILEMNFDIDLNRIETLITGLNKKELLNKFSYK